MIAVPSPSSGHLFGDDQIETRFIEFAQVAEEIGGGFAVIRATG